MIKFRELCSSTDIYPKKRKKDSKTRYSWELPVVPLISCEVLENPEPWCKKRKTSPQSYSCNLHQVCSLQEINCSLWKKKNYLEITSIYLRYLDIFALGRTVFLKNFVLIYIRPLLCEIFRLVAFSNIVLRTASIFYFIIFQISC